MRGTSWKAILVMEKRISERKQELLRYGMFIKRIEVLEKSEELCGMLWHYIPEYIILSRYL